MRVTDADDILKMWPTSEGVCGVIVGIAVDLPL